MKIINLMENTKGPSALHAEHGLSIYVETDRHKLLVDTGSSDKTWENAARLQVDLTQIDTVFLSHGHYDHAGGILAFAAVNPRAKIYMHHLAGGDFYDVKEKEERYIGINKDILKLPQCVLLEGGVRLDEELSVFGNVTGRRKWPTNNLILKKKLAGSFEQDSFSHEQHIVVEAEGRRILLSGCAHNGILNILDRFRELYGGSPDLVISGFHMMKKEAYDAGEVELIRDVAAELKAMNTYFYSGHCTGLPAFAIMKEIMGEKLQYMHSGDQIV